MPEMRLSKGPSLDLSVKRLHFRWIFYSAACARSSVSEHTRTRFSENRPVSGLFSSESKSRDKDLSKKTVIISLEIS